MGDEINERTKGFHKFFLCDVVVNAEVAMVNSLIETEHRDLSNIYSKL